MVVRSEYGDAIKHCMISLTCMSQRGSIDYFNKKRNEREREIYKLRSHKEQGKRNILVSYIINSFVVL